MRMGGKRRAGWPGVNIVCAFLISGCASFRSGNRIPASSLPPVAPLASRPSLAILAGSEGILGGRRLDVPWQMLKIWREQYAQACLESGCFSRVNLGSGAADLRAEVRITDDARQSFGGWLWLGASLGAAVLTTVAYPAGAAWAPWLALYTVPMVVSDTMTVRTVFTDAGGKELGTITTTEKIVTVMSLPLLPLTPFLFPATVMKRTFHELGLETVREAFYKGYLKIGNP